MARIRTIKPEFFTSPDVCALGVAARLTFVGLWTICDDHGRCPADARVIKGALWPLDDDVGAADVEDHLAELEKRDMIARYSAGGRAYLCVRAWDRHQRPTHRGRPKYPAPPYQDEEERLGPSLFDQDAGDSPEHSGGLPEGSGEVPEGSGKPPPGTGNREQGTREN